MSRWVAICFAFLLATAAGQQPVQNIEGRVVGIIDGDTLTLLTQENRQIKVRLSEIDAPESSQPYGDKAKKALSDLVFGKEVKVVNEGIDKYGRTIGRIYVGDMDVSAAMVSQGAAWVYRKYSRDLKLLNLESFAKNSGQGIWKLPEDQRVPPWEWRHTEPAKTTVQTPVPASLPPARVEIPPPPKPEPSSAASGSGCPQDKPHFVRGYTRKDGHVVNGYCRR